jgi:hypothetical protein
VSENATRDLRRHDPWGDLVNYFRDLNVARVKFGLVAEKIKGRIAFMTSDIQGPQDAGVLV